MRSGSILVAQSANTNKMAFTGSPHGWLKRGLRLGAFRASPNTWARLHSIGVASCDASVNLCPPGEWDVAYADQVAALIRDMSWRRIICCGRAVAGAFGVPSGWPYGELYDERIIVVPHPSGRCRWWNDGDTDDLRRRVDESGK